jgi:Spy/CpxP family protein refolding chaperone
MIRLLLVMLCIAVCAPAAFAEPQPQPQPQPPSAPADPIGDRLFPPDAIMSHQKELGIDGATRDRLVAEIQRFQTSAVKIQWDLQAAGGELAQLLGADHVDENAALAAADKVMQLEHDLKRAHLQLLIRLKNVLTPAQQARLRQVKAK